MGWWIHLVPRHHLCFAVLIRKGRQKLPEAHGASLRSEVGRMVLDGHDDGDHGGLDHGWYTMLMVLVPLYQ